MEAVGKLTFTRLGKTEEHLLEDCMIAYVKNDEIYEDELYIRFHSLNEGSLELTNLNVWDVPGGHILIPGVVLNDELLGKKFWIERGDDRRKDRQPSFVYNRTQIFRTEFWCNKFTGILNNIQIDIIEKKDNELFIKISAATQEKMDTYSLGEVRIEGWFDVVKELKITSYGFYW